MNKLATVITVSLTALTLTACGGAKTPEDTATAFVKAAYTNDSKAVLDMLYFDESIGEEGKADVKGKIEQLVDAQTKKAEKACGGFDGAEVVGSEVKDTEATVKVKVSMKKACPFAKTEDIKLVKVKDEWKVNL